MGTGTRGAAGFDTSLQPIPFPWVLHRGAAWRLLQTRLSAVLVHDSPEKPVQETDCAGGRFCEVPVLESSVTASELGARAMAYKGDDGRWETPPYGKRVASGRGESMQAMASSSLGRALECDAAAHP